MKYFDWIFCQCFLLFFLDVRKEEQRQKDQGRTREEEIKRRDKTWIRKEPDADGYFLLQLAKIDSWENNRFLTAEDASSLKIARK
jgi:hypothetical protein